MFAPRRQGGQEERTQQELELLDRAFETMFSENSKARRALLASRDAVLRHSIGKKSP